VFVVKQICEISTLRTKYSALMLEQRNALACALLLL